MSSFSLNMKLLSTFLIIGIVISQSDFPHENFVEVIGGEEYVQTPFGLMLRECVQNVPSGTHIEETEEGTVHMTNDQENFVRRVSNNDRCSRRNPLKLLKEWIDNGGYTLPSGLTLQKFEGFYKVPNTPQKTNDQILYYFIGSQNNDSSGPGLTIIQPVLTYHKGWFFQSWNCCPQGYAFNSPSVQGVHPGDTLYGSVEVDGDNVSIISKNSAGKASQLSVTRADRNFDWIDATLEVYNINSCQNFPTQYLEYSKMNVTLSDGSVIQPQWVNNYGNSTCNGQTTIIDPQTIRIQHNVPQTQEE